MSLNRISSDVSAFLARKHGSYIDGAAEPGAGRIMQVINPADGSLLCSLHSADIAQANRAMESAERAFQQWRDTPTLERGALLLKLADKLAEDKDTLAYIESLCSGKTLHLAKLLDVDQSIAYLRYFAGWAGKITGESLDVSLPSWRGEKYTAFTRRHPVGVVAGIIPWNFSVMIAIWKMAAALVCGCTVVLKPSEYTPLTLLRIAELATECGFPPGVITVINGYGSELGPALISHDACAKVSFTGSVATGKIINALASQHGKKVTLELGGKNAALFMDDMSPDDIVAGIIEAGYLNQGQICAAAECFWLPKNTAEEVLQKLTEQLAQIKIGDPLDEHSEMGPIANQEQQQKLIKLVDIARAEGDEILFGGQPLKGDGYYFQPTAIKVRSADSTLMKEETFGPIGSFMVYDDAEEALRAINRSPFGLSASVWSKNLSTALRFSERLQAGIVWINMHTHLDPAVPFGGSKGSGSGREFGSAFIADYTEIKSIMVRY